MFSFDCTKDQDGRRRDKTTCTWQGSRLSCYNSLSRLCGVSSLQYTMLRPNYSPSVPMKSLWRRYNTYYTFGEKFANFNEFIMNINVRNNWHWSFQLQYHHYFPPLAGRRGRGIWWWAVRYTSTFTPDRTLIRYAVIASMHQLHRATAWTLRRGLVSLVD